MHLSLRSCMYRILELQTYWSSVYLDRSLRSNWSSLYLTHACLNLVGSITQTDILEHLLQPIVVVLESHPGTLPAPFRVAFVYLLLFEPSWRVAHAHICRSRPLKPFTAFFGRCHCVGNKLKIAPQPAVRQRVPIGGNLRRQGLPCGST